MINVYTVDDEIVHNSKTFFQGTVDVKCDLFFSWFEIEMVKIKIYTHRIKSASIPKSILYIRLKFR